MIWGSASEVVLDPVPRRSAVNLDSVESVPVGPLVERLGRRSDGRMRASCAALEVAVDCPFAPAQLTGHPPRVG